MTETRQPGQSKVDAKETAEAGLDAGGHEPAPPSKDVAADEARDSIQDAFDGLQAMHPDEPDPDEADQEPAGSGPSKQPEA